MNQKYDHIKFIIERFDNLSDTINNKGLFYIGLNTFILSGISVGLTSLYKDINSSIGIWIFLAAVVICCLVSSLFTISAIKPYMKDNFSGNDNPSLMFFGGIARYELSYLKQKIDTQTPEQITDDAIQQMHSLAKGLTNKFKKLRVASYLLQIQFCLLLPLFVLLIKNLK
jgi:hypothetical protein